MTNKKHNKKSVKNVNNDNCISSTPRIAIYIRCESFSLDEFEEKKQHLLECCANLFSYGKAHIYADIQCNGFSRLEERAMLGPMMSKIRNNEYDILLVSDISRISRNPDCVYDITEYLTENGVRIYTPEGQMRWIFSEDGRAILI